MFEKLKLKFKVDKDSCFKWGLILLAGLLGLGADIFDRKKKDKVYNETINREVTRKVNEKIDELMAKADKAE